MEPVNKILNAVESDLPVICNLFEKAIQFLKENNYIGWKSYDKAFIESDMARRLLFKVTIGNKIACIFSVCYSDPIIWRERETGNAMYLHRIVSNRIFAGEKLFGLVLDWAIGEAKKLKLDYIRMDTWADNGKIIAYYKSYGFSFIENYTTPDTDDLPIQHRNLSVALLQLTL
ncbi:N-acetyltransferase [Flavobacterium pallidum]|uniref:N-acetyltransferase n=1 Tax=Flavobacterium pallidum TaxID=2172098 RepID=A0A2S1SJ06_9FLAO|nr:N-acetyltransferase [Flavobacterium pallidum]AWI26329.1 N-acetyltransferase [Flavobacterium pallidum]